MSYRDEDGLELILELVGHIERRSQGLSKARFLSDRDEIDLMAYRLSIIGEASGKLSQEIRARNAHIDWISISAMRNVIAHDYRGVDPEIVWETLGEDLASLAQVCRAELGLI